MSNERTKLSACVSSATSYTPLIVRGVVNATHSTRPLSWRRQQLDFAIRHARALLDDLVTQRTALGWREQGDDAA